MFPLVCILYLNIFLDSSYDCLHKFVLGWRLHIFPEHINNTFAVLNGGEMGFELHVIDEVGLLEDLVCCLYGPFDHVGSLHNLFLCLWRVDCIEWATMTEQFLILFLPFFILFVIFISEQVEIIVNIFQISANLSCCSFHLISIDESFLIGFIRSLRFCSFYQLYFGLLLVASHFDAAVDSLLKTFCQFFA